MFSCKIKSYVKVNYKHYVPNLKKKKICYYKAHFVAKNYERDSANHPYIYKERLKCLSVIHKGEEALDPSDIIKEIKEECINSKDKNLLKSENEKKRKSEGGNIHLKGKKQKGTNESELKKGSLFNCTVHQNEQINDLVSPRFNPVYFDIEHLYLPEKEKAKSKFKDSLLFTFLTNMFNKIEDLKGSGAGSKKNVATILANMFRVLIYYSPKDLLSTIYIILNKVAPDYLNVEAGVGEALILKTMSEAYSRTESSIKKDLQQIEDLGIIAENCSCKMRTIVPLPRLTIQFVFHELKSITSITGSNSQQKKREVIKRLLVSAKKGEAKYIVRFLQQRLRIGVNSASVLQALAYAFVLTRPEIPKDILERGRALNASLKNVKDEPENNNTIKEEKKNVDTNPTKEKETNVVNTGGNNTYEPVNIKEVISEIKAKNEKLNKPNLFLELDKTGDTRLLPFFQELKKNYCGNSEENIDIFECMEKSVKCALCELPNIEVIVENLLNGDDMHTLSKKCTVKAGLPVQPMLAKPTRGLQEVLDRFNNMTFTCEYKYDGERAQVHYIDKDNIKVFSRNLENMTEKYPDVIQIVKEQILEDAFECIIDSEVVAYDIENKKILPFQVLTTRKRKDVEIENIKVKICLFPFDLICCNGVPVIREPLEVRRKILYSLLKPQEGVLEYATHTEMNNIEDIDIFLQDAIENNCEGLMVKTLLENASYEPSRRSLNWLKVKKDYVEGLSDSVDLVPIAAYYGKGKRSGVFGAFVLATYNSETENFQTVCKAGTGFSDENLTDFYNALSEKIIPNKKSYYEVSDKLDPDVWFDAHFVWEVKAADLSLSPVHTAAIGVYSEDKGIGLRFPRFLRIREDKNPEQATTSQQIVEFYEAQFTSNKNKAIDDDENVSD